jgi:hypothetical protein
MGNHSAMMLTGRSPKNSEKNLSHCYFVHHKYHTDWTGANPGLNGERPATNRLSYGMAFLEIRQSRVLHLSSTVSRDPELTTEDKFVYLFVVHLTTLF